MKFWKLLCALGCIGFLLVLVLAYVMQDPAGSSQNNGGPDAPRPAPHIPAFN
jgi:hypothetical protein